MEPDRLPAVLFIAGTNASGKSDLGIRVARRLGHAEIVSADSRQLYRGLDLGAGKVPPHEREDVPHHLIDVAEPGHTVNLHEYLRLARAAMAATLDRGNLPIVVGGTGLYVRALARGYLLDEVPPDALLRARLEAMSPDDRESLLARVAPGWDVDPRNTPRVARALEYALSGRSHADAQRTEPTLRPVGIWVTWPDEVLRSRIAARLRLRLEQGMVDEGRRLIAQGVAPEWLWSIGLEYRHIVDHIRSGSTEGELEAGLRTAIWRFAKRQRAWFKRDDYLAAVDGDEAEDAVESLLSEHRLSRGPV